jgi:hypothetical protein
MTVAHAYGFLSRVELRIDCGVGSGFIPDRHSLLQAKGSGGAEPLPYRLVGLFRDAYVTIPATARAGLFRKLPQATNMRAYLRLGALRVEHRGFLRKQAGTKARWREDQPIPVLLSTAIFSAEP